MWTLDIHQSDLLAYKWLIHELHVPQVQLWLFSLIVRGDVIKHCIPFGSFKKSTSNIICLNISPKQILQNMILYSFAPLTSAAGHKLKKILILEIKSSAATALLLRLWRSEGHRVPNMHRCTVSVIWKINGQQTTIIVFKLPPKSNQRVFTRAIPSSASSDYSCMTTFSHSALGPFPRI